MIAFTSPSDAWAPRATIFCTMLFQSPALIRWLVTTSTLWQPEPQVLSTSALAPPGGRTAGANAPTFGRPRRAAAVAATALETAAGRGLRGTSGSANATNVLLTGPPKKAPPLAA